MEKFRWCFIGTGKLAHNVAKQILESGRHEIVSCYTRNYEKALDFAREFGCTAFDKPEDAITAEGVDGVYVVTPHNVHYKFVRLALELKKPVLCEKPFTVVAKETDELISFAKSQDVYLCEAMWTWFSPCANKTKQWVDEGKIGNIDHATFTYHLKSIKYAPRVADPKRAGGALLDITIYPITYAYRLWGYPKNITSTGTLEGGIDLGEDIVFEYDNGLKVDISASIADMKGFEKMKISGESGSIEAVLYHAKNAVTCKKGFFNKEVFKGDGPRINSYVDEFDTVASEIREGLKESRMVPLKATSDVMHIIETIMGQIGLVYTDLEK